MLLLKKNHFVLLRWIFIFAVAISIFKYWPTAERLNGGRVAYGYFSYVIGKGQDTLYLNDAFLGCWVGDFYVHGCPGVGVRPGLKKIDAKPSLSRINIGYCQAVVGDYMTIFTRKKYSIVEGLNCDSFVLKNFTSENLSDYRLRREGRIFRDGRLLVIFFLMLLVKNDLIVFFNFLKKGI